MTAAAVNIITHNLITHSGPADPRAEQPRKVNEIIVKMLSSTSKLLYGGMFSWRPEKNVYDWNVAAARAAVKLSEELFLIPAFSSDFHKKP